MAPGPLVPRDPRGLSALALCLLLLVAPTSHGGPAVRARPVDYPGAEGDMPAHLYEPRGAARLPGVLVLHTLAGPGPNLEVFAKELAATGYVTLTPDFFALHDFGPDGRTDHPLILGDLKGALDFLAKEPRVNPDRLGVVGFSFGGRTAVQLAAAHPARLRAVVVYYAIASHAELGRALAGRAARAEPLSGRVGALRAPVLIHHGEADTNVPLGQARLLHRALLAAGKSSTLHTYPGADHLFNFSIGPDVRFDPAAARLSWERTVRFLDQHLKPRQ
ncbi:MAG: dienelactone hydrolase family protein [Candidatus Rokubacteria bacterium]|nr:dienelactone hydrolase family protein [Candidatus Rokubacteria bacterium]